MAHRSKMWLIACFLGLSLTSAVVQSASYSSKHNKHSTLNASHAVFEARGDVGGGGGSSYSSGGSSFATTSDAAYGAPSVGAASYDSYSIGGGGGGGYSGGGGGYGAPAATAYKYQIYPAMQMGGGGGGWGWGGGGGDDDDDFGLDKELIGLLGLKGLKGLKGLAGLLPILKGLLLLKKIGLLPLLLLFSPLLLPLLLFKLALLLLPLLLLLLIPIPVITTGRQLFERATGKDASHYFQDTLDDLMAKLPNDLSHIISKIKNKAFGTRDSKSVSKDGVSSPAEKTGASSSRSHHKSVKFVKPQQTSSSSSSKSSKSVVPTS